MIEAVVALVGSAFALMWPFYWPLLVVLGLRYWYEVFVRGVMPRGEATDRTWQLTGAVGLLGAAALMSAIVCASVPGMVSYALIRYVTPDAPMRTLVMELLYRDGLVGMGLFVVFTGLSLWALGACVGAILWTWFGEGIAQTTLKQWVRQHALIWTSGFLGSVVAALSIPMVILGAQPAFIMGIGGMLTAGVVAKWVFSVAVEFVPEQEDVGEWATNPSVGASPGAREELL